MKTLSLKRAAVLLAHAFIIWVLCAAVMAIGTASIGLETTLIIHLIAAPIFAIAVSSFYFWKFDYSTPLQTAVVFVSFVIFMDLFLVAMIIIKSFDMFTSIIGTWLPFILIFASAYLTGIAVRRHKGLVKKV